MTMVDVKMVDKRRYRYCCMDNGGGGRASGS